MSRPKREQELAFERSLRLPFPIAMQVKPAIAFLLAALELMEPASHGTMAYLRGCMIVTIVMRGHNAATARLDTLINKNIAFSQGFKTALRQPYEIPTIAAIEVESAGAPHMSARRLSYGRWLQSSE